MIYSPFINRLIFDAFENAIAGDIHIHVLHLVLAVRSPPGGRSAIDGKSGWRQSRVCTLLDVVQTTPLATRVLAISRMTCNLKNSLSTVRLVIGKTCVKCEVRLVR